MELKIVDTEELSEILKVPKKQIEEARKKGLPHYKIGKHYRYVLEEALAFFKVV